MDKTVLTLAVDSTQVGTAAAAFDRMVNAGNAAATTAGKVTSATIAQGKSFAQNLVPAINRSAEGMRTLADTQKALGQDATRQSTRPRATPAAAPVQSVATGRTAPLSLPNVGAGLGSVQVSAAGAGSLDRLSASARTARTALTQLTPAADATVRSFRQLNATQIRVQTPQGLSQAAAAFAQAQRVNPAPLRQVAAAFEATAEQAARAASAATQANRVLGSAPRGTMTQAGQAARTPLAAPQIISAATGQRVPTATLSTSEMTVEAGRAQSAIERLTSAARDQRSALAQVAATAGVTAGAYRELAATPVPGSTLAGPGGRFAPVGGRRAPVPGTPGGNRPTPAGTSGGDQFRADQMQQLTFQLNDFFVQVASGGSALTALIQQGSQLSGTFGGIRPAFQAVLNLLTPMRVAAGGAAAAIGALAIAYRGAAQDSKAFRDAAILTGNSAGQTEGQFNALARATAANTQSTVSSTREIAQALLATGQIGPQAFDKATEVATRFSETFKKTAQETADVFSKLAEGPSKFAAEINKSMNLWSASELKALGDMEDAGDIAGAQIAVLDKLNGRFKELDGNLDGIDRALIKGKKTWSDWWDAAKSGVGDMFGLSSIERNIGRIDEALRSGREAASGFAAAKAGGAIASRNTSVDAESQLQDQLAGAAVKQANAQNAAERAQANKRAITANELIKNLVKRAKPESVYKEKSDELERSFKDAAYGGTPVSAADQKAARAQLKKEYTPAKAGGRGGSDASQVLAAQLQGDLRQIDALFQKQRDAYEFQNRFVETAYRNGNISLQTLMQQRREALQGATNAELESLDKEATRLQEYLKKIKDPSEITQTKGQLEEVAIRRDQVELQGQRDLVMLNQEEAESLRALSEQVTNYRANLLQLQGDEAGAAALRAQSVIINAKVLAAQSGGQISEEDVAALGRLTAAQDAFNEVQRQTSLLAGNSARAEESFALAAEQSGKSLLETERGIYRLRVEELKQLGALAQKAKELAEVSTDPRIKAFAADLALEYAKAADAIDPALNRLRDARRELAAGLANTAGQAPSAFVEEYSRRRQDAADDITRQRDEYSRKIDMLEGYLATTADKQDKARLRERIKAEEEKRDGVKGESRGNSVLKAINDAVVQPMAEQVFNTVNKLLITDPLQKYLEGQLKSLTEGGGMLAGFFKDALGIQADPKDIALQQQTAALTASSSALDVLRAAAEGAANALSGTAPRGAPGVLAQGTDEGLDPIQPAGDLADAQQDAASTVLDFSRQAAVATSDIARLANMAGEGGVAMSRLPGIVGLFQSAVALLSSSNAASSGGGLFGSIASLFGGSSGGMGYEAAVAATGIFHQGGIVGQPKETRNVSMSLFAGAPKYHTGGIVGKAADKAAPKLASNEVAAILMGGPKGKREEVLHADDPRHRDNLGMSIVARIMAESRHEGLRVKGARELGGPVSKNSMYRVNEKGPELLQVAGKQYLMTGSQGGNVVPHDGKGKGGDTTVVHVNVTPPAGASAASAQQWGAQAGRHIKRAMGRNT